jgi:hypothetical protein
MATGKGGGRGAAWKRVLAREAGLADEAGPERQEAHAHPRGKGGRGEKTELPEGWSGVQTREILGKFRFFCRLKDFDWACPRCQEMHVVRHRKRKVHVYTPSRLVGGGTWDPTLHRMTCRNCGLTCVLGVTATTAARGRPSPPPDTTPTLPEILQLRQARFGGEWEPSKVTTKGKTVNRLVRKEPEEGEEGDS